MSWREDILDKFPPGVHRLTFAADSDGMLTEEGVAARLEQRGYETLEYGKDPIAFRYAYEKDYRSRWESGEEPCLIVLIRGEPRELDALPYDLIRSGRRLSFGLGELLPNLDYSTVAALDREYLDRLYAAYRLHAPERLLGRSATSDYVLLHIFSLAPETVTSQNDLIGLLLKRHYEGWRIPGAMEARLLDRLRSARRFEDWPLNLASLIAQLMGRGFDVYLTSDHGNVEARGVGNPSEGAVAETRGERARVYADPEQRSYVADEFPGSVKWSGSGLPKDYLPLLAPGRTAFVARKRRIVGHGGISLEELAVPFAHAEQRASGGDT